MADLYRLTVSMIHSDEENTPHQSIFKDFIDENAAIIELKMIVDPFEQFFQAAKDTLIGKDDPSNILSMGILDNSNKNKVTFEYKDETINEYWLSLNANMPKIRFYIEKMPGVFAVFAQDKKLFPDYDETNGFVGAFDTMDDVMAYVSPQIFYVMENDESVGLEDFPVSFDAKFKAQLVPITTRRSANSGGIPGGHFNTVYIGCQEEEKTEAVIEASLMINDDGSMPDDEEFLQELQGAYVELLESERDE